MIIVEISLQTNYSVYGSSRYLYLGYDKKLRRPDLIGSETNRRQERCRSHDISYFVFRISSGVAQLVYEDGMEAGEFGESGEITTGVCRERITR